MARQVVMPQLGESVVEGTVTRWMKKEGDTIQEMEPLLEVSTDKVDTEIPSPASGTVLRILVAEGETVQAGTVIAMIGTPGEDSGDGQPQMEGTHPVPADRAPETADPGAGKPAEAIQEMAVSPADPAGEQTRPVAAAPVAGRDRELGFISPVVARIAQEHHLDLTQVTGTGEGGRITKKDVLAYLEAAESDRKRAAEGGREKVVEAEAAPWETPGEGDLFRPTEMIFNRQPPVEDRTQPVRAPVQGEKPVQPPQKEQHDAAMLPGDGQIVPMSPIRRRIAEHMVTSKRVSPHVTTVMEADLHQMMAHFQANKDAFARDGARLTYTAYFVAAAVQALRAYPIVNSSWKEEGILVHPRLNIGLAVSLGEEGLIVPVLKGADELSLLGLARAIQDLADRARSRKLQPDDVKDGTFTITNHGISGSLFATPVINQPQCGILGVGAIQKRVVVVEDNTGADSIAIRPMVYLSLTFDHRILDGASADGFLSKVVEVLEGWR